MKKRRNVFVAFVVVAVLLMGIGYAALTDTLTIGGKIGGASDIGRETEELFNVYFEAADDKKGITKTEPSQIVVSNSVKSPDSADVQVKWLGVKGDTVVAWFTITNEDVSVSDPEKEAYAALLKQPVIQLEGVAADKLTVRCKYETEDGSDTYTIQPGESVKVYVKIVLNETLLTAEDDFNGTLTITLDATAVEKA